MLVRAAVYLCVCALVSLAGEKRPEPEYMSIPAVLYPDAISEIRKDYGLVAHVNPFYLRGDFDGDRRMDYVLLIEERVSGKVGLAVFLNRQPKWQVHILAAGRAFLYEEYSNDDFDWLDAWQVKGKGRVGQGVTDRKPPVLLGDAMLLVKSESASGLIYWDGKKFCWYQQGD